MTNRSVAAFAGLVTLFLLAVSARPRSASAQVEEAWVARYDGPGPAESSPTRVVMDADSNVFVLMRAQGRATGFDYVTVKYDRQGEIAWTARFDGGWGNDVGRDLAVDAAGSAYVTGESRSADGSDFVTVKYDADGNEVWSARHDDPDARFSAGRALDVDDAGNVYVAGHLILDEGARLLTLKYDADGNELWSVRTTGVSASADFVAARGTESVYVAGGSSGDALVVKYDADGNQLQAFRHADDNSRHAFAIDGAENAYVAGNDTTKLDAAGNELWTVPPVSRPTVRGVAVDGHGFVYVLESDFTTTKYDPSGEMVWSLRHETGGFAIGIALDGQSNVVVAGTEPGVGRDRDVKVVKYDPDGKLLLSIAGPPVRPALHGLAVDDDGSVVVIAQDASSFEARTLKYDAGGNELWDATYRGITGGIDEPRAMVVDRDGNVIVTGVSDGGRTHSDFLTAKYDSLGNELWVRRRDINQASDWTRAIAADARGNVYVTGASYGFSHLPDYITVKYDPAGNELWMKRHEGFGVDVPDAITVDERGNAYIAGGGAIGAFLTVKYDPDGTLLWASGYRAKSGRAVAIAVDRWHNVHVAGGSNVTGTGAIVKYDADGNLEWAVPFAGADNGIPRGVVVDAAGSVYATGYSPEGPDSDILTVKYDAEGNALWVARHDGPLGRGDFGRKLALDGAGNLYVAGYSQGETYANLVTLKYDTSGNEIWSARSPRESFQSGLLDRILESEGPGAAPRVGLAVDRSRSIYVTGRLREHGHSDYEVIKYDADGRELWNVRDGLPGVTDVPRAIAVDREGGVFVTGTSADDFFTVKYDQTSTVATFRRADVNEDATVDLSDGVGILTFLFIGSREPGCLDAADADDSGVVELTDAVAIFGFLFLGGGQPPIPFESCGDDPTADALDCAVFEPCP